MVNRFKEQREKRNISIERLSEKSGVPVEKIIEIESPGFIIEDLSANTAADIAIALGCLLADLIYEY
ncbi:MAG: helix-turn-helix transcriptional regulator [Oscillospiraceae bacterium]|nr:helix-turn-helix transcriptional regulator [Oscillospiraceae bacterium]